MEGRAKLPRKAREDTKVRMDEEIAKKLSKKRSTPENDEVPAKKKERKAKSEERPSNGESAPKKNAKTASKAKPEAASLAEKSKPVVQEKPVKAKGKGAKTVSDDITEASEEATAVVAKGRGNKKVEETAKSSKKENQDEVAEEELFKKAKGKKTNGVEASTAVKSRGKKKNLEEEVKNDENSADDVSDEEPAKKSRGKKAANGEQSKQSKEESSPAVKGKKKATSVDEDEPQVKKTRGKKAAEQSSEKSEGEASSPAGKKLMNNTITLFDDIDFGIKEKFNFKITTWNVAGLRALLKKTPDYFTRENADVICMNEIKCSTEKELPEEIKLDGYHAYWCLGKGTGVGMLSKVEPINVTYDLPDSEFSEEKRLITAEFEKFYLVSVYVVNSGRELKTLDKRLKWNEVFDEYIQGLDKKKPVIIAGDLNVSHEEIDLANPKTNKKSAGFTQEERDGFTKLLSYGFVDTFRHFYPDLTGAYTYWTYMKDARSRNTGWRLDYFVVSKRFMKHVKDNVIRNTVKGSDHCPIVLFLQL